MAELTWSINFLKLVQEAQDAHGLRAGDYIRYRQYCQRRLRRIFVRLNFLHGGKKFQKRQVVSAIVSDFRHLHILLLRAERAWAHSEQLREENTAGAHRKHHYRLNKLRRAVKWSKNLQELSKEFTDESTQKQANAYAAQLAGLFYLAKEDWEPALQSLSLSRDLWANLASVETDADMKDTFLLRIAHIEQSRRICWFKTGRDIKEFQTVVAIGGGSNESRFTWRGKPVEIRSEKVRQFLNEAADQQSEISRMEQQDVTGGTTVLNNTLEKFDRLFITYNDAIAIIKQHLREEAAEASVLHFSLNFLQYTLLENTIRRNLYLVKSYALRLVARSEKREKRIAGPADIVRLYDMLLQNISDILAIPGVDEDSTLGPLHQAQCLLFRAARMYWKGEVFKGVSQYGKAIACYELGMQFSKECGSLLSTHKLPTKELEDVLTMLRKSRTITIGTAAKEEEDVVEGTAALTLNADTTQASLLLEHLDEYVECKDLVGIPPAFRTVAAKPLFFDVAGKFIDYPEIPGLPGTTTSAPVEPAQKAGGLFSRWWGR
eukprot:TRINITY_DN4845_c0_g1_i1.p1 TRINITY_DN4845_c0_g1~~TRINITY_DN4845_c0_g1_i1.p1  ORF type:complete len:547 (-),score=81.37 TRINITY_DN4845_c0_g1_i1:11-1651(-)